MNEQMRSLVLLVGDSILDGRTGNHLVVRYDQNNKPNIFEINGEIVTEAEYRAARAPFFP